MHLIFHKAPTVLNVDMVWYSKRIIRIRFIIKIQERYDLVTGNESWENIGGSDGFACICMI